MIFAQINGVMLTVEQPGMQALRPGDPWEVEGIRDLVAAMTGTAGSPVMVDAPSLTPTTVQAGNGVEVFIGTWTGVTPTAVLRFRAAGTMGQGVDVTEQIVDGVYVTTQAGTLTLTVTAAPLAAVSVNATVSAAPAAPDAFADDQWSLQTGTKPGELVLTILDLPDDKGSPINALRYRIGGGTWQTLSGTGPGQRVIDGGEAGEDVSVVIVAVNAVGESEPSDPKAAETGAPAPTLQATITPDPLVAGEDFEVVFSAAPDTVSPSSLVADQSNPLRYTGTAPVNGSLAIGATKAGWQPYAATVTVQPAPPEIVVTSANTMQVRNATAETASFDLTITSPAAYAGTRQVDPAQMSSGPVAHVDPVQTGTAAVGQVVTLDPGLWLNFESAGPVSLEYELQSGGVALQGVNGLSYTVQASDQGKSLVWHVTGIDQLGERTVQSNAIAILAASNWWDSRAFADLDYQNNRARINGVNYASIADARTAGAIIVDANGSDTVPVTHGASYVLAATGVTPETVAAGRYLAALDDGADGDATDNLVVIQHTNGSLAGTLNGSAFVAGSPRMDGTFPTVPVSTAVRAAVRVKSGAYAYAFDGSINKTGNTIGAIPAVTQLVVGNRADGTRPWLGAVHRVTFIDSDLTDADLTAVLGA